MSTWLPALPDSERLSLPSSVEINWPSSSTYATCSNDTDGNWRSVSLVQSLRVLGSGDAWMELGCALSDLERNIMALIGHQPYSWEQK